MYNHLIPLILEPIMVLKSDNSLQVIRRYRAVYHGSGKDAEMPDTVGWHNNCKAPNRPPGSLEVMDNGSVKIADGRGSLIWVSFHPPCRVYNVCTIVVQTNIYFALQNDATSSAPANTTTSTS